LTPEHKPLLRLGNHVFATADREISVEGSLGDGSGRLGSRFLIGEIVTVSLLLGSCCGSKLVVL
jgi:hypothetical protein